MILCKIWSLSNLLVKALEILLNWNSHTEQWGLKCLIRLNISGPLKSLRGKVAQASLPWHNGDLSDLGIFLHMLHVYRNKQHKPNEALPSWKPPSGLVTSKEEPESFYLSGFRVSQVPSHATLSPILSYPTSAVPYSIPSTLSTLLFLESDHQLLAWSLWTWRFPAWNLPTYPFPHLLKLSLKCSLSSEARPAQITENCIPSPHTSSTRLLRMLNSPLNFLHSTFRHLSAWEC